MASLTGVVRVSRLPWTKPTAFLSSTSLDLADARRSVRARLEEEGFRVVTMDQFPAMAQTGSAGSEAMVRRADVFVGIYARRYGTLAADARSVTEHEYDAAVQEGLPRLCFVLRESASWPDALTEPEPGRTALANLLERIKQDVVVAWFDDTAELAANVRAAADEYLGRAQRKQWRRFLAGTVSAAVMAVVAIVIFLVMSATVSLIKVSEQPAPAGRGFTGVAVDPGSPATAATLDSGEVALWRDASRGPEIIATLPEPARRVAFLTSHRLVAGAGQDLFAIEIDTHRIAWTWRAASEIRELAASGTIIAVGTMSGTVNVIDSQGRSVRQFDPPTNGHGAGEFGLVKALAFSLPGSRLGVAFLNGPVAVLGITEAGHDVVITPDRRQPNSAIAVLDADVIVVGHQQVEPGRPGNLFRLSVYRGGVEVATLADSDNTFWVLSPLSSSRLVSADWNGRVALWNVGRRSLLAEQTVRNDTGGPGGLILDLSSRPDGRVVAVTENRMIEFEEAWQTVGIGRLNRLADLARAWR
jgi:hypothetical protein